MMNYTVTFANKKQFASYITTFNFAVEYLKNWADAHNFYISDSVNIVHHSCNTDKSFVTLLFNEYIHIPYLTGEYNTIISVDDSIICEYIEFVIGVDISEIDNCIKSFEIKPYVNVDKLYKMWVLLGYPRIITKQELSE